MTRDVLVSITGARFSEHDKEDVEMIIGGDYFWKNGKHYVLYEEVMEESGEVVKNTVKITPDSMDILKKGSINYFMHNIGFYCSAFIAAIIFRRFPFCTIGNIKNVLAIIAK